MKSCCDSEVQATRVIKITVETSPVIAKGRKKKIAEIQIKGHFCPIRDVTDDFKMFTEVEYSTVMILGGSGNQRFVEHVDQQPMALIIKDISNIDVPEQMRYSPSYSTKIIIGGSDNRRFVEHFYVDQQPMAAVIIKDRSKIDVPVQMKYPWLKGDQQVIPTLPGEEDTNDEGEHDDDDEFEEEIVVMNVRRESMWRTWLEHPKQETKTAGTFFEDLIEFPSMQAKTQDSPSEESLIEERIESVERPPLINAKVPDLSFLENI